MDNTSPTVNLRDSDPYSPPGTYTAGTYRTEAESAEAFDDIATRLGFNIAREVSAQATTHVGQPADATVRIDRILMPSFELIRAGWNLGPVGVELKRSGIKLGKPLAQAFDYIWARWDIGVRYIFLWPVDTFGGGPLASVTTQHRIGHASPVTSGSQLIGMHFGSGGHTLANLTTSNGVDVRRPAYGHKVGSR